MRTFWLQVTVVGLFLSIALVLIISFARQNLQQPPLSSIQKTASQTPLPQTSSLPKISPKTVENRLHFALDGFAVAVFAENLPNVRDLTFSAKGTLLASQPNEGKIVALTDTDSDHREDSITVVLSGLNRPHGIAVWKDFLFVVEETKVTRFVWNETETSVGERTTLFQLPKGGRHWTRSIGVKSDGTLFVSLGSTCDVCFEKHGFLAAIIMSDWKGSQPRVFATGVRNATFLTLHPKTDEIYASEMGRDFLGDDLPPDEVNIIQEGKDYGWPICWGDKIHDTVFDKNQYIRNPCEDTAGPAYAIPAHSAPLGLTFVNSPQFPDSWQDDLLIAYHGSWNRSVPTGYKIVRVKFDGGKSTEEETILTGFLRSDGTVIGRPVDVTFDPDGALFISDDDRGVIYKIVKL